MEDPQANSTLSSGDKNLYPEDSGSTTIGGNNNKTAQCSVVSIYHAKIFGTPREVRAMWSKSIINHSLSISVHMSSTDVAQFTCKVDLKPWPFWSKKGFKSFEVDSTGRIDLFWDMRSAKFSGGPEPLGGYYVAIVCNEEVILLLGDHKKEAFKRTKSRPSLEEPTLVSKRENVFGKKCFSTRANLTENKKKEHDIVVENSISGPKDPEMWISIDGVVLVHVSNLQWKFRGNETIMVEQLPVQVFWDVHDWLFSVSGHALFIFKPGLPQEVIYEEREHMTSDEQNIQTQNESAESLAIRCSNVEVSEFCFILYAWKTE